jgi:glycosyltransferase involved in cell wall biosynthesis
MRIAYLSTDFGVPIRGTKGASVHVRQLVSALTRRGHDVVVVTPNDGPAGETPFPILAMPFAATPALLHAALADEQVCAGNRLAKDLRNLFYSLWLEGSAAALLDDFQPDLLYERYALFGTAGLGLAQRRGVPLLLEVNAPLVEEQREHRGLSLPEVAVAAQRLVFAGADELLVVSRWLADYAQAHGAAAARVTVVPNAADPELFRPRPGPSPIRRRLGWEDRVVLGFVGAMKPWHGVPRLVDALRALGGAFRLLLVGEGPALDATRARVRELGLDDRVHFAGTVLHDEVPDWLAAADVAMVPYDPAAAQYFSPVKLFECMAMAMPIAAARAGQTEEILEQGRYGALYDPGDPGEPAATVRRLAADLPAARRVAAAAREHVLAHHTWERNAERVEQLAARALARRQATPAERR